MSKGFATPLGADQTLPFTFFEGASAGIPLLAGGTFFCLRLRPLTLLHLLLHHPFEHVVVFLVVFVDQAATESLVVA